jgi:putative aminopeptidase FrvX
MELLKTLCTIHAPSGEEGAMKEFVMAYAKANSKKWKVKPRIISAGIQDCLLLVFGTPRTAIFAHVDTIGFTVRYFNQLLPIGSPDAEPGVRLVGEDSRGKIDCELDFDKDQHALYKFGRAIDRGTSLTYQVNFEAKPTFVQSAYLDNRLGVYVALRVAETLKDGVIAFSCWEEHGGGSVGYLADYIFNRLKVRQALIADMTWATDGVALGKGVAISLRDRHIPRKVFVERIIALADKYTVPYQLEVEGVGSSDGGELQRSHYPFDWCFVGTPSENPHTPREKVHREDIDSMVRLYQVLMSEL